MVCRRDFLKSSFVAGAALLLGPGSGRAAVKKIALEQGKKLAVVKGTNAERMVLRALELMGGVEKWVAPGTLVVVKPNASFANPAEWGNNTNPEVVGAVCALCLKAGARKVVVVDYPLLRGAEAPRENGIWKACSAMSGVQMNILSELSQFRTVRIPGGVALKETAVARAVLDADLVINLPVAKAHDAVAASIGLKNWMGVIWDRASFHTMMDIQQAIADLARIMPRGLTLTDMTRILTTNGPKGPGEVATPNLIVAGVDPVAVDGFCLTQSAFNGRKFRPGQLRYLRLANEAGLGEIDLQKMVVIQATV